MSCRHRVVRGAVDLDGARGAGGVIGRPTLLEWLLWLRPPPLEVLGQAGGRDDVALTVGRIHRVVPDDPQALSRDQAHDRTGRVQSGPPELPR